MSEQQAKVKMYTIEGCPYCKGAIALLEERGISFEQEDLSEHPDRRAFTSKILEGHQSVPLVLIDGDPIGGFSELQNLDASGELKKRIFGS